MKPGKEITDTYMDFARQLDAALWGEDTGRVANWFHFAAWGTHSVNLGMSLTDPDTAAILGEAELAIYGDVIGEAQKFLDGEPAGPTLIGGAFKLYDSARTHAQNGIRWKALNAVRQVNFWLAGEEQRLIDPYLKKIPGFVQVLILPGEVLTVPQPWEDLKVRLPWIGQIMSEHLEDRRLFAHPYASEAVSDV